MNYHKIDICNMDNGDGLRVCLWISGCDHYCDGCFNQQTWDVESGQKFDEEQIRFIEEAIQQNWCSGLTLTGGDPLFQENLIHTYNFCAYFKNKYPNKTIWLYTGYTYEELIEMNKPIVNSILNELDILVDGPFVKGLKSPDKHWVGSSNQRVIDMKKTLEINQVVLHNTSK